MGAEQSSTKDPYSESENTSRPLKTCCYDLLEVGRQASDAEIKKAYRKKALELHPDRNYMDVENATQKFAEIQSAYDILSDPQERAWYDSHRDTILGDHDQDVEHFEHNVRLTSTGEILKLIGLYTKNIPFTDAPNGFYGSLCGLFSNLAMEEAAACDWQELHRVKYPSFGCAEDSYEETVKPFYAAWSGFATRKTFSWLDEYRYTDAPDRRVRRLMEKENRRLRDDGVRGFNDTVRSLVAFARKRDPRYVRNTRSEADRQRLLREATAAQAARSRAANSAKLNLNLIPDWSKRQDSGNESLSEAETLEDEEYECVTCRKIFKSERQYEAHEKSKKHTKAVQYLKKQMQKEDKLFALEGLDEIGSDSELSREVAGLVLNQTPACNKSTDPQDAHDSTTSTPSAKLPGSPVRGNLPNDMSVGVGESEEIYGPKRAVGDLLAGFEVTPTSCLNVEFSVSAEIESATPTYIDRDRPYRSRSQAAAGKARRANKAAQQNSSVSTEPAVGVSIEMPRRNSQVLCMTCGQSFGSRTRLFRHIKELDHGQPNPSSIKQKQEKRL